MTGHRTTTTLLTLLSSVLLVNGVAAGEAAQQPADRLAEASRYKGTEVKPDPKAIGAELALQARIARLMSANDFVPEARAGHFRWMLKSRYTPITGWDGVIVNVTPETEASVVTVRFHVRSVGGFCNFSTSTERYWFSDGKLHLLDLVYKGGVSTWN